MALYLCSSSIWLRLQLQRSAEGVLYLTQPQAHFVSLDWPWLRQPNILRLSLENKLCSTTRKCSFVATKFNSVLCFPLSCSYPSVESEVSVTSSPMFCVNIYRKWQTDFSLTDLPRSYLDVEVAPLIWDFEDLWPGKTIDPQPVPVNKKTIGTDTQHYFNPFWILQQDNYASIIKEHTWKPHSYALNDDEQSRARP